MMKFNDFQKYEAKLTIPYDEYFQLIYETKHLLEARLSPERSFVASKFFYGCNRRKAVQKASSWYSKNLKRVLGPAHVRMTIDDPMNEVVYDDEFVCTDLRNRYLDEATTERLLKEANGDLGKDDSLADEHHTPASVKRLRRRRRGDVLLGDQFVQSAGGTIYYKMTEVLSESKGKTRIRKIKLSSKSLEKAEKEVVRRGLNAFEKYQSANPNDA